MPTIIRQGGFEIRVYTRDHFPAYAHCFKAGAELIVNLDPLEIRENNGMSSADERMAVSIVAENRDILLAAWGRIHGTTNE